MLRPIFEMLNEWIGEQNIEAKKESFKPISACTFYVVGQTALLEAKLDLEIAATADVDAVSDAENSVVAKLSELLSREGLEYDQLSNEIWMPPETVFSDIYRGSWVSALLAEPEFVMVSKAKMAMNKNRVLLRDYIAFEAKESFFELCGKHGVDLSGVVRESDEK